MGEGTNIPRFEGRDVEGITVVMSGKLPFGDSLDDMVLGIDDVVQMVSMFQVVKVGHDVDPSTGKLIRVQYLKPIEAHYAPIESGGDDDGVIRSLPTGGGNG